MPAAGIWPLSHVERKLSCVVAAGQRRGSSHRLIGLTACWEFPPASSPRCYSSLFMDSAVDFPSNVSTNIYTSLFFHKRYLCVSFPLQRKTTITGRCNGASELTTCWYWLAAIKYNIIDLIKLSEGQQIIGIGLLKMSNEVFCGCPWTCFFFFIQTHTQVNERNVFGSLHKETAQGQDS